MASNIKQQNASDIANKFIHRCPNLKKYLEILLMNIDVEMKSVGRQFKYPKNVQTYKLFPDYGLVMDYYIRKLLANRFHIQQNDNYMEIILKNVDIYFTYRVRDRILPKDIEKHYKIYKDSNNQALDILESIKKVSLSTTLFFKDPLPKAEVDTNKENLLEIKQYFEKLPYSRAEIKSNIDCEYFEGAADIVFDRKVLYEIKTSQFPYLSRNEQKFNLRYFNKLILYGFGYYKKTGVIIKEFRIYNPLLGQQFTIKLGDMDMKHFEEVVKQDIQNLKA